MSENRMKFVQISQANYDKLAGGTAVGNLTAIDSSTIYFISDSKRIYKGTFLYGSKVLIGTYTADSLAAQSYKANDGILYINKSTKEMFIKTGQGVQLISSQSEIVAFKAQYSSFVSDTNSSITTLTNNISSLSSQTSSSIATAKAEAISSASAYTDSAIAGLDASEVGGTGKVITTISETDGVISATAIDLTSQNVARSSASGISATTVEDALVELKEAIDDSNAAQQSYKITAITGDALTALGTNVKQAYKLQVSSNGGAYADVDSSSAIKIYKDSALKQVYLGADDHQVVVASDGTFTKGSATDGQYLNFVYQLTDGSYDIVAVDVNKFLTESQFDGLKGLAVSGSGVVSVKLGTSNEYVKFDNSGNIIDTGINTAIATAKAEAISSANSHTDSSIAALSSQLSQADSTLSSLISANTDAISTINGNGEGSIAKAVSDAAAETLASANSYTDSSVASLSSQMSNSNSSLEGRVGSLEGRMDSAEASISNNSASISTLNGGVSTVGSVDYKIDQALQWVVISD